MSKRPFLLGDSDFLSGGSDLLCRNGINAAVLLCILGATPLIAPNWSVRGNLFTAVMTSEFLGLVGVFCCRVSCSDSVAVAIRCLVVFGARTVMSMLAVGIGDSVGGCCDVGVG
jgi:hypothetical protein